MIDRKRLGPWALITGASSGIGRAFALQIAASGVHVALVSRRVAPLQDVALERANRFGVQHRVIAADLSQEGFVDPLVEATRDLDIGLVISNVGGANPGRFLAKESAELAMTLRLSALSHAEIARCFGSRLIDRRTGGLLFVGAMGAATGAPFMAHDGGAKAYVQSLALALHEEFKPHGVYVTALLPGRTDTPVLANFGLDPRSMPMRPMQPDQVVSEGLRALSSNRPIVIPGRMNRIAWALLPPALIRSMAMRTFEKASTLAKPVPGPGTK